MARAVVRVLGVEGWQTEVAPPPVYQDQLGELGEVCSGVEVVFALDLAVADCVWVWVGGWVGLYSGREYLGEEFRGEGCGVGHFGL